jgi:hypothetical protein
MGCDSSEYWNAGQTEAGQIAFQKNKFTIDLLKNWISYGSNPNIITDLDNIQEKNFESFVDHRHDQSILTNLLIMNKVKRTDLSNIMEYVRESRV